MIKDAAITLGLVHPEHNAERIRQILGIRSDEVGHETKSTRESIGRGRGNGNHGKGVLEKIGLTPHNARKRKRAEVRALAAAVGLSDEDHVGRMPAWVELIDAAKPDTAFAGSSVPSAV